MGLQLRQPSRLSSMASRIRIESGVYLAAARGRLVADGARARPCFARGLGGWHSTLVQALAGKGRAQDGGQRYLISNLRLVASADLGAPCLEEVFVHRPLIFH